MNTKKIAAAIIADAGQEIPGLEESLNEMKAGKAGRVHSPAQLKVREVRKYLGLSQAIFARTLGASITSLRDWEQGRHEPPGTVSKLVQVLEKHPEVVEELRPR